MTSVLTLVKGRGTALENLLMGLSLNTVLPDEMVIVFMNEPIRVMPSMPFPVRCFQMSSEEQLPLAEARNHAAVKAAGDFLIFLDVDCIPSSDLILKYQEHQHSRQLLSGQIRYLTEKAMGHEDLMNHLVQLSAPDPIRAGLSTIPHALFWSLNFACSRQTYFYIGGFDEDYKGYGAEDTDFSFTAAQKGISIQNVQAFAFHQYHANYSPPLNHFTDIICNANRFFTKWKVWPMEGWLKAFDDRRLIVWSENEIRPIRLPNPDEIKQALKT
ncbi:hypothetical protein PBAL39_23032 [Pedobacter sp. BAL39]|uniref:galactosyltransferase-related protein n=1 Tax=Pedobacter sp. BAL39 TaxID=391596 RepID=UPI0001559D21|nr:galactosyltransferase-related protein [Pedobacter sp. BAL39]EDM35932.1 hypothetical protein PBAL39_23032 [Pedobacter sp. BAL39]